MQIWCGFLLVILLMNTQHNCGVRADDKNITRLLNNQVIVSRQIMCVLDKSPCDQLGRQLKGTWRFNHKKIKKETIFLFVLWFLLSIYSHYFPSVINNFFFGFFCDSFTFTPQVIPYLFLCPNHVLFLILLFSISFYFPCSTKSQSIVKIQTHVQTAIRYNFSLWIILSIGFNLVNAFYLILNIVFTQMDHSK